MSSTFYIHAQARGCMGKKQTLDCNQSIHGPEVLVIHVTTKEGFGRPKKALVGHRRLWHTKEGFGYALVMLWLAIEGFGRPKKALVGHRRLWRMKYV